jgi:putative ABC transport system permease protein
MPDPSWAAEVRRRLADLRLGSSKEMEIVEELTQHLELRYEELLGGGVSAAEARRLALDELVDTRAFARESSASNPSTR